MSDPSTYQTDPKWATDLLRNKSDTEKLREAIGRFTWLVEGSADDGDWVVCTWGQNGCKIDVRTWRAVVAAVESTLPKTRTVRVWRVMFAGKNGLPYIEQRLCEEDARELAQQRIDEGGSLVNITGPHQQEVPA